jgi:biopolymer transport protein ExbD
MGGVSVESGGGGRRALDSEINMIPMIDLLMVTISFLLLTAVWSSMGRVNANAEVPGQDTSTVVVQKVEPTLHVDMRSADKFVLQWKTAGTVARQLEVPRREVVTLEGATRVSRYPDLALAAASEWNAAGSHRDLTDGKLDQAVLHTDDETPYGVLIGVIDALYTVQRPVTVGTTTASRPAFNVTFSIH